MLVPKVHEKVKQKFSLAEGSHDWFHIERVWKMSCILQEREGGNKMIVELTALLHDISDHKYNGGDYQKGQEVAYELIMECGGDSATARAVSKLIPQISFKGSEIEDQELCIEGLIVRDADRLDAMGAIGIARAFAYGGSRSRPLYNPEVSPISHQSKEAYLNSKSHTVNHFYEKLLLLKDRIHTDTAKEIAERRHSYMLNFLDEFYKDWSLSK